jgi:hypothetical protein
LGSVVLLFAGAHVVKGDETARGVDLVLAAIAALALVLVVMTALVLRVRRRQITPATGASTVVTSVAQQGGITAGKINLRGTPPEARDDE